MHLDGHIQSLLIVQRHALQLVGQIRNHLLDQHPGGIVYLRYIPLSITAFHPKRGRCRIGWNDEREEDHANLLEEPGKGVANELRIPNNRVGKRGGVLSIYLCCGGGWSCMLYLMQQKHRPPPRLGGGADTSTMQ